jgi:putative ABC transport system permease protein
MLVTLSAILLFILAITSKVSGRIRRITPLIALRGGIDTFHFGKNRFPLATSPGNLHLLLGIKQLFSSKKQSISIGIIGILMSFTIMFSLILYKNLVLDTDTFVNIIGSEKPDIAVQCNNDQYEKVLAITAKSPGVAKTLRYSKSNITISKDDSEISCLAVICEDFDQTVVNTVYKGRYPQYNNEIVLSNVVMKKLNAKLGNIIEIKGDHGMSEYIVVGISQHLTQLGKSASLTEAGMKKAYPDFKPSFQYLYLEKDADIQSTIDYLTKALADYDVSIQNAEKAYQSDSSSIRSAVSLICVIIEIISSLIVVLILYYLVKVKIIRERISLGINKALGFTTRQLILHINISLCTVILFSSLIGSLMASLLTNRLFALMMSIAGFQNFHLKAPIILTVITIGIMTLMVYLLTSLVSLRIRKLKPRELITE